MNTQCIVGSPEGKHFKNVSNLSHSTTHCCILSVETMLNNRETDRKKSAQYKVKSQHYKWLLLITENLLKNLTNFSSTDVRICVKDATPLIAIKNCEAVLYLDVSRRYFFVCQLIIVFQFLHELKQRVVTSLDGINSRLIQKLLRE